MPQGFLTLLDVAKLDAGVGYPVIDQTIGNARELEIFPADTIDGATMELTVLTALPTVGFRSANEGSSRKKAEYATKIFQTGILEEQVAIDIVGVLAGSKDQARTLEAHSKPFMKAALKHIAKQIWYGTGNDVKGFPGMTLQYAADTDHEVDATGSSALSSVWFVEVGPENLEVLFGNGQSISMSEDWKEETVTDANDKVFRAATNWIKGRPGLRLANKHSAVRIKNVGTANGKTLTDALMGQALQKCIELEMNPTHVFMTPRSNEQLRNSRTTYSPTGQPAPRPTEFQGIPIVETTNLSNSEETITYPNS
jgi:hypothetical protein